MKCSFFTQIPVQDVSAQKTRVRRGAQIGVAVRLVQRCIVGHLVGCYGDLAGSELCVGVAPLYSLESLVI